MTRRDESPLVQTLFALTTVRTALAFLEGNIYRCLSAFFHFILTFRLDGVERVSTYLANHRTLAFLDSPSFVMNHLNYRCFK